MENLLVGTLFMPLDPKLRKSIRRILFERDMTQMELAERTGLAQSTISNLLGGRFADVKLSTIESIARALDCELEMLFKEIPPDNLQ